MKHLFRRKRLGLLSLSLFFASLLLIHKLKLPEKNGVIQNRAFGPRSLPFWDAQTLNCSEDDAVKSENWFQKLDPRFHQFVLHRHCRYFPMLINHPEKCKDQVHLLMVVKSVIEQHDRREAVRKTWGREYKANGNKNIKTVFLLGSPSIGKDAKNLQKLIEYEDQIYGDILQWDFMDTFFNLTLKEVNFLKWFHIFCPDVEFIFKGDDDVFVNTENLLDLIGFKVEENRDAALFVGDTISKAIPIRNRQSKYYIPKELYDKPYPPYVGGGGFLMSSELARRLFAVSQELELYPIDDVFLGMCLQKLGISPEMHSGFRTFGITRRRVSAMNSDPCFYKNLIVVHKLSVQELLKMWKLVQREELVCAQRTSI
ncbi:UDP-GlcNAc:betaGal beta-1,3-N-acetylglucosaminyltransferase 7, like [Corythoichthys intestinalis]|uniref:UDP-GlcNAc:betaGal beta-1,3-N-acetylglucosaminyltransferase 7, like n=1 Tax=Corythoichthys intestinalis TaxID=161448 RepID=UPI0025A4EB53|nr:UDP-GlcNAc:betaGal beta-1,3-N-acetylglucosaminyltransferase 7, like [Corythoichthys intestinalis]XP_061803446.1 UDP-GlcNAc:betaGal beta-1,3-N-acetylglucosaminyltransferase 7-like [Nerophis lumbriciformis]